MSKLGIQPLDARFQYTVMDGVEISSVIDYDIDKGKNFLECIYQYMSSKQILKDNGKIRFYGIPLEYKKRWEKLQRGDIIIFLGENQELYRAYISFTFISQSLTRYIYAGMKEKYTYLYMIENLQKLEISYEIFRKIIGYEVKSLPKNFIVMSEAKESLFLENIELYSRLLDEITKRKYFAIEKLHIVNFRCFEEIHIRFHEKLNVIIGLNGAGKSAILEALSIAIGCFIGEFDGLQSTNIREQDIRIKGKEVNGNIESALMYPTKIWADTHILPMEMLVWERALNRPKGSNTKSNAKDIVKLAKKYLYQYKYTDEPFTLPLLAYYNTDRFYAKVDYDAMDIFEESLSRFNGYRGWDNIATSEKYLFQWIGTMEYIHFQRGYEQRELKAVKEAMKQAYHLLYPKVEKVDFLYNRANARIEVVVQNGGNPSRIPLNSLSDGLRGCLVLVADIAHRMAQLNPEMENILETPGIVLIDEIDMHLHPKWQSEIIKILQGIFINIQLICTTHSPMVLAHVRNEYIQCLDDYDIYPLNEKSYGRSVKEILSNVMDSDIRAIDVKEKIEELEELLEEEKIDTKLIQLKLESLKDILGEEDEDYRKLDFSHRFRSIEWEEET